MSIGTASVAFFCQYQAGRRLCLGALAEREVSKKIKWGLYLVHRHPYGVLFLPEPRNGLKGSEFQQGGKIEGPA